MKRELRRRFDHDIALVRAVLRRWDPIGVLPESDASPARDEYDTYAPQILSLLYARASKSELAERLEKLRTDSMGIPTSRPHDEEIAEELLTLQLG